MGPLCGLRLGQIASLTLNNNNNKGVNIKPVAKLSKNFTVAFQFLKTHKVTI